MRKFKDDAPIYCSQCDYCITAGEDYIKYDGMIFCSTDCLGEYLVSQADYEEVHLNTADDYADIAADEEVADILAERGYDE